MKNNKISLAIAAIAVAGFTQVASAAFPGTTGLYLVDVTTSATQFIPMSGVPSTASWSTAFGGYTIFGTTGTTFTGGAYPSMDLAINSAIGGTDTIQVWYSNGTFGPSSGGSILDLSVHGGTVTSSAFLSTTPFGQTTSLGSVTGTGPTGTDKIANGVINNQTSYYLTIMDQFSGNVSSADTSLTVVPEPSTVVAGALLLLPFGVSTLRILRKNKAA